MRKVLHKVKSQWVVLGVLGGTVVALGTTNVQQVSAAEVDGAVTTEATEQSGNALEPHELVVVSTEETAIEEVPYAKVEIADSNLEEGKTELSPAETAMPKDEIIAVGVGTNGETESVIEDSSPTVSEAAATGGETILNPVVSKDVTAPMIDASTLNVSRVAVGNQTNEEMIDIFASITDESSVTSASVVYVSPLTGQTKTVFLYRNENSGLFEGSFNVTRITELGTWKVSSMNARDAYGNLASLSSSSIDLCLLSFTVTGSTGLTSATHGDINKPVIDVSSVRISKTSTVPGETITISAKFTDDVGVIGGTAYYQPPTGEYVHNVKKQVNLNKNEASGLYEGTLIIDNSTHSGTWILTDIIALDSSHNQSYYSSYNADLSAANFTVTGTNTDISMPVIDVSSVRLSKTLAVHGETITIYANVTDDIGVKGVLADYESPNGLGTIVSLQKNEISGLYEGKITNNHYPILSGKWTLRSLTAYDAARNITRCYNYEVDLSAGNYTVTGKNADISKPVIDASSVRVSQTSAVPGETITLYANITDDVGVTEAKVWYESPSGTEDYLRTESLYKNKISGLYEGRIAIGNFKQSGNWILVRIDAYDAAGNKATIYTKDSTSYGQYYHYRGNVDLSAANFVVQALRTGLVENTDPIPHGIEKIDDPTLPIGETKVIQAGLDGSRKYTYAATFIDGVETKRELVRTTTITAPINEIIRVGTQPTQAENVAKGATLSTSANFDTSAYVAMERRAAFRGEEITVANFDNTAYVTDGQTNAINNYANGIFGLQWVQLDLGAARDFNAIQLWHYYGDGRSYRDVVVQLSNDATFTDGVATVFNNDKNGSVGFDVGVDSEYSETIDGKVIAFATTNARYVRFYSNGSNVNGWNHYVEIKVYGSEPQEPPIEQPATTNVATGGTLSMSANFDSASYAAMKRRAAFRGEEITSANFDRTAYVTDGQTTTINNYANGIPGLQWIQMDLGAAYELNAIQLWHYYGDGRSYQDVVVQLSNDETFTDGVATVFNNDKDGSAGLGVGTDNEYSETSAGKAIAFAATNARYVRFYSNGSNVNGWNHYVEIKVYGSDWKSVVDSDAPINI